MAACTSFDPLIAERASGAPDSLSPADAARLDAHLAACDRCRSELAAYQQALGLARLAEPTDAERQALTHLPTRVRVDLERAPIAKVAGRLLGLGFVAAAIVVVVANRFVIPGAERRAAQPQVAAATWTEPDPDALLARIEQQHPELAVAADADLARAEELADAAYLRAVGDEE